MAKLEGKDPGPKWGDLSEVSKTALFRLVAINAEDGMVVASHLALWLRYIGQCKQGNPLMPLEIITNPHLGEEMK